MVSKSLYPQIKPSRSFATWILSVPCKGLDHDLDTPKEKLCLPTVHNKSLQSTIQIEFVRRERRTACGSVNLIFPPFQSLRLDLSCNTGHIKRPKLATQENCWSKLYECWWQDLSQPEVRRTLVSQMKRIKNNIFAVITEQEKMKSVTSQYTVQSFP